MKDMKDVTLMKKTLESFFMAFMRFMSVMISFPFHDSGSRSLKQT